ncbi:MAG: tRNA preQ1(34) S-adenosylmethionine ribosyltransferase-isomerase QueA [Phycisphaerales bacterium]|nr:tRNA preQ1(34) S-adenosylmethionine ribosyltransferase-isomerase QueA [Phycisphaerales bacterium]
MRTSDLDYELPPDRIATRAAEPRDSARLLVTDRRGVGIEHRKVRDLPEILSPGDVLVFNTTRVLPARLIGRRVGSGGKAEGLFLAESEAVGGSALAWICLLRGGHLRPTAEIELEDQTGSASGIVLKLVARIEDEPGAWIVSVGGISCGCGTHELLDRIGRTPLPPYILKSRASAGIAVEDRQDRDRYQSVYAGASQSWRGEKETIHGSVAAPTAGLHFTPDLLARLSARGVERIDVTLHVGTGTFRPVETEFLEQHPMHTEACSMSPEAIAGIELARAQGRRIIPVGTTSTRTLETFAALPESSRSGIVRTRLLVKPGYQWRWCDGMMTNFHLPRSTLLAITGAMLDRGVDRLREIYASGIAEGYRFYSYGDAMLVLP